MGRWRGLVVGNKNDNIFIIMHFFVLSQGHLLTSMWLNGDSYRLFLDPSCDGENIPVDRLAFQTMEIPPCILIKCFLLWL
jgi:hypothetical protein